MAEYTPDLPDGYDLSKSYEYGVEVAAPPAAAAQPVWLPVRRAKDINPTMTPITQGAQTYDDLGSPNDDVSAWSFVVAFNALVNRSRTTGELVPELKLLRDRVGKTGADATVLVRWFHKPAGGDAPDPDEAYQGLATVGWVRNQTGAEGTNEEAGITLTGKGPARRIPNPFEGWAPGTAGAPDDGGTAGAAATTSTAPVDDTPED
jgi:hypothetical protein